MKLVGHKPHKVGVLQVFGMVNAIGKSVGETHEGGPIGIQGHRYEW